jgi:hypothetical protein
MQMTSQVFCQICGDSLPPVAARADGWLVERWRIDPAVWVVRCYRHISEWSLRCSAAGRTKEWRAKMRQGRARAATGPEPRPTTMPLSLYAPPGLPDDADIDYGPWEEE